MEEATPLQASPQASPAPARCCAACCRWLRCLAALLALAALGALQGFEYVRVARLEASLATAVARVAVLEEQTAEIEKIDHEERLTREEVDAELRRERQAVNRTMRRAELALAATADGVTQYAKDVEAQVGAQVAEVVASLDQYIITTQDQFAVENKCVGLWEGRGRGCLSARAVFAGDERRASALARAASSSSTSRACSRCSRRC